MDDLDDLERRAQAVIDRNRGLGAGAAELECPVTCGEVLALIERCRSAERDCDALEDQMDVLRGGIEARVEGWRTEIEELRAQTVRNAELRPAPVCSCGWVPLHCRVCGRQFGEAGKEAP